MKVFISGFILGIACISILTSILEDRSIGSGSQASRIVHMNCVGDECTGHITHEVNN